MVKPAPWRGNPLPNTYTLLNAGSYTDSIAAVVPDGWIDLDRSGLATLSLTLIGGQFSFGTQVWAEGIGGPVNLNFNSASTIESAQFNQFGRIEDRFGQLNLNVNSGESFFNNGTISVDLPGMANNTLNVTLNGAGTGFNGPTRFQNFYTMSVDGTSKIGLKATLNVSANANTEFHNYGTMRASGPNGSINISGAGSIIIDGKINVDGGAQVNLQGNNISGNGTITATAGSLVQVQTGTAALNETVVLNSSILEFGGPPKKSFIGPIVGFDKTDTILIDNVMANRFDFGMLDTKGAGLGRLDIYDIFGNLAAELKFSGHYSQNNFFVTPLSLHGKLVTAISEQLLPVLPGQLHS